MVNIKISRFSRAKKPPTSPTPIPYTYPSKAYTLNEPPPDNEPIIEPIFEPQPIIEPEPIIEPQPDNLFDDLNSLNF